MTEHNLPWVYRPREFDDWGWIRDAAGDLAACARGEKGGKTHDEHRTDKTDPYGEYAALIVKAVNSHEHLIKALEASCGYLLNAKIDLETGATKATAIRTIEGGLLRAKAVLAIVTAISPAKRGDGQ